MLLVSILRGSPPPAELPSSLHAELPSSLPAALSAAPNCCCPSGTGTSTTAAPLLTPSERGGVLPIFALFPKTSSASGSAVTAAGLPIGWGCDAAASPAASERLSCFSCCRGSCCSGGRPAVGACAFESCAVGCAAARISPEGAGAGEPASAFSGVGAELFGGVRTTLGVLAKAARISSSACLVSATGVEMVGKLLPTAVPAASECCPLAEERRPLGAGVRAEDTERANCDDRETLVTDGDAERARDSGILLPTPLPFLDDRGVRGSSRLVRSLGGTAAGAGALADGREPACWGRLDAGLAARAFGTCVGADLSSRGRNMARRVVLSNVCVSLPLQNVARCPWFSAVGNLFLVRNLLSRHPLHLGMSSAGTPLAICVLVCFSLHLRTALLCSQPNRLVLMVHYCSFCCGVGGVAAGSKVRNDGWCDEGLVHQRATHSHIRLYRRSGYSCIHAYFCSGCSNSGPC